MLKMEVATNMAKFALVNKLRITEEQAEELLSQMYKPPGKELDALKYAIVKGEGEMAWTATHAAMYKTEKGADGKLAQLERLKYPGYRKVKLTYEEI